MGPFIAILSVVLIRGINIPLLYDLISSIALGLGKEPSSLIATLWPNPCITKNNDAMNHTYNFVMGLKFIIYSFLILFGQPAYIHYIPSFRAQVIQQIFQSPP